jgi:hypothetical protein
VVNGGRSVEQVLHHVVQRVLSDRAQAAAYATDPWGYLAAAGVTDRRLAGIEVIGVVRRACRTLRLPPRITSGAAVGSGPQLPLPAGRLVGRSPAAQLVQILHYLLRACYIGDHYLITLLAVPVSPPRTAGCAPTQRGWRDQPLHAGAR